MKTYTLFQKYFMLTIMAVCLPSVANAMFPTFDASNTKSSIETNVNVVKQTKEIQKVKEMSGKINSSIGSVTSSISKFKSENLEKIQEKAEKVKKEKERIEKKKAEIEKIKKDVEEQKKKIDDAKARAEKYKQEMNDLKNKATSTVKDVSSMSKDVSSLAKTGIGAATSTVGSTFGVSDEISAVQSKISSSGSSSSNASNYINSDDKYYDDDEQYSEVEEVEEEGYVQETQPISVAPTRASFGSAPRVAATARQQAPVQVSKSLAAPEMETQQATSYSAPAQAATTAGSGTQAQPQMQVQRAASAQMPISTANVSGSSASSALVSDQGNVVSGDESSVQLSNNGATVSNSTQGSSVSTKKAATKPKVTHRAYYNDLNLVSKRKSVMGAQAKPVNTRVVGDKSTQARDLTGRNISPVAGGANEVDVVSDENADENTITSSSGSASQSGRAFFAEGAVEGEEIVDENGEVVEADEDEEVVETERFVPVQKPETKTIQRGKRVPFGAKISPAELEKELKALEAEEALEKKTDKQSFRFSEELVFAQLAGAAGVGTVHDNYIEGKFALSSKLVNRCEKNAKDLADVEVLKVCIAEFVACINDPSEGTARGCRDEFNEILSDQALNTLAIALEKKNITASFEEKVVEKNAKDAAAATTERADIAVGTVINEETVKTINDGTDMLTMQVILDVVGTIKDIKPNDLDVVIEKDDAENGG